VYEELYEIWKRELENAEIGRLPPDFYPRVAGYLKSLREEGRMLDKKTVKARLLGDETKNVKHMIRELTRMRYRKILKFVAKGHTVPSDVLTAEEGKIYAGVLSFTESFQKFAEGIMRGHVAKIDTQEEHKKTVLRFLKDVPAIVGADMKTYGSFKPEDVASLPVENAKILVKQSLAEKVETS
jgi:DNA replication initiation complex subunit (GINS family)